MRGVGSLASIFLSSSEHLVYEQDKLGNKQKIESPLPGLPYHGKEEREDWDWCRNMENSFVVIKELSDDLHPWQ